MSSEITTDEIAETSNEEHLEVIGKEQPIVESLWKIGEMLDEIMEPFAEDLAEGKLPFGQAVYRQAFIDFAQARLALFELQDYYQAVTDEEDIIRTIVKLLKAGIK